MLLSSPYIHRCAIIPAFWCLVLVSFGAATTIAAPASKVDSTQMLPDPDTVIKRILGLDEMTKNVCLIDSHQMVDAADLPGRLVTISTDRQVPSDLLRYSFRKEGCKTTTQVNPPSAPIQATRLESGQAYSGTLLTWFGAKMEKDDIAELRTVPLPATSISVDDLDEKRITDVFSKVPQSTRKGLGIVTNVIPYEVLASVCKKVTRKAEAGIWYIHLGKDTYSKQQDELRRYYLVAVYTPLVFFDDIGVIVSEKSLEIESSTPWQPKGPAKSRSEMLSMWLKAQDPGRVAQKFAFERRIPELDGPALDLLDTVNVASPVADAPGIPEPPPGPQ